MIRRRPIAATLAALAAAPLLLAAFLLYTEAGLRTLIQWSAPTLRSESVRGSLATGATLRGLQLTTDGMALNAARIEFSWRPRALLAGRLQLTTVTARNLELTWRDGGSTAEAVMAPLELAVERLIVDGFVLVTEGRRIALTRLELNGRATPERILLERLRLQHERGTLESAGSIELTPAPRLDQRLRWTLTPPGVTPLAGSARLHGGLERLELAVELERPQRLRAELTVEPLAEPPRWHGRVEGDEFDPSGFHGEWPALPLTVEGRLKGTLEFAEFDALSLTSATGSRLALQGRIDWSPRLEWHARLQGKGLDPADRWPQWPGRLTLEAELAGDEERLSVRLDRLSGELRGHPIEGGGQLLRDAGGVVVERSWLATAENRLELTGRLAPHRDLSWSLDAPRLEALISSGGGALHGEGELKGGATTMRFVARLEGERLRYREHRAGRLSLKSDLDLNRPVPSRLQLEVDALASPLLPFTTLSLEGEGPPEAQRLTLLAGGPSEARVSLAGAFRAGRWEGLVEEARFSHRQWGTWRQEAPSALRADGSGAELGPLCLNGAGRLCLEGSGRGDGGGGLALRLERFPAQRLLSDPDLATDALLDGILEVALDEGHNLRGRMEITADAGTLRWSEPDGPELEVAHQEGRLRARLDPTALRAEARLGLGALGRLEGELVVPEPKLPPEAGQTLHGRLALELERLDWLAALMPRIAAPRGRAAAELRLEGPMDAPRLKGEARLSEAAAELPELGIVLSELNLVVEGREGGPLRISGGVRSGAGRLDLSGRLLPERKWRWELDASGAGFEAMNTADAKVVIDPALHLSGEGRTLRVEGRVGVPEARISPRPAEALVTASADVRRIDQPPIEERHRIESDVTFELGERVRIAAAGFTGRIQGALRWRERQGEPPRAEGELRGVEASYRLYGQRLKLDQGRLRFTGGPPDNPELDLTTTRRSGEVLAGARIRGTLRAPRLALFSEPPMDQSDTLAYLLFGRPARNLSGSEGELVLEAAAGLFDDGEGGPIQAIGEALGLDEARIRGDEGVRSSAVVVGKYLSPRLYLGYAAGLFQPSSTVELRYRLSDRWEIKSESGTAGTGADLLFTLER